MFQDSLFQLLLSTASPSPPTWTPEEIGTEVGWGEGAERMEELLRVTEHLPCASDVSTIIIPQFIVKKTGPKRIDNFPKGSWTVVCGNETQSQVCLTPGVLSLPTQLPCQEP